MLYSEVQPALSNLKIGNCNLNDSKCNNKFISANFKSILFHDFNSGKHLQAFNGEETHFKLNNNIPSGRFSKDKI